MPHKRNPVTSEQISGLARVVRSNAQAGFENVALWHERDISHSSVERVILPDSTTLADYLLQKTTNLIDTMFVYPQRMQANLDSIVNTLQKAHARVVLAGITLPPNYGAAYIQRFDGVYPSIAKKYHTPLLPFMLENVWNVPGDMQQDGIHATAAGNAQVARNLLPVIEPLLTK